MLISLVMLPRTYVLGSITKQIDTHQAATQTYNHILQSTEELPEDGTQVPKHVGATE
jgi:hypothetical protein